MIEILNYEKANKNNIIGYVDIKIPLIQPTAIICRNVMHIQSEGRRWFNLPQLRREKGEGKPQYLRYFQFEQEVHNGQVLEMLSDLVKKYCHENKITETPPLSFSEEPINYSEDLPF